MFLVYLHKEASMLGNTSTNSAYISNYINVYDATPCNVTEQISLTILDRSDNQVFIIIISFNMISLNLGSLVLCIPSICR